ncbi:MAG TPA: lasso peptide biosynthesis B2 protein [Candidatus Acidoferrales bacterium]|nr:lasso peptide biosynthesis B2 protein [Candidatus Acidoferrales bacterium]
MMDAMSGAWSRFRKLSGRQRHDFFLGLVLLPVVTAWVSLFKFRSVQETLERWYSGVPVKMRDDAANLAEVHSAARMVDAASRRGIVRGNCLSRSIVLWWLLRRRGIPTQLRIGARKTGNVFEAHAWVEMAGLPINDSEDVQTRYTPFEGPVTGKMAAPK